jgi:hypothetical protein
MSMHTADAWTLPAQTQEYNAGADEPADAAAACITNRLLASNESLYNNSGDFVEVRCLTQLILIRGRCYCQDPEAYYQWYSIPVWILVVICLFFVRRDQRRRDARQQQQTTSQVADRDRSIRLAISRLPTCAYAPTTKSAVLPRDSSQAATPDGNDGNDECPVCLCTLVAGDQLRELPCSHKFHAECIDRWLIRREYANGVPSCPLCKKEVLTEEDLQARATAEVSQASVTFTASALHSQAAVVTMQRAARSRVAWRSASIGPRAAPSVPAAVATAV